MRFLTPLFVLLLLQTNASAQPISPFDGFDVEIPTESEATPATAEELGPEEQAFVQQMMQRQGQAPGQPIQDAEEKRAQMLLAAYRQAIQQVVRRPNTALDQMAEEARARAAERANEEGLPPGPEVPGDADKDAAPPAEEQSAAGPAETAAAEQAAGPRPAPSQPTAEDRKAIEEYKQMVITGDWEGVKRHLAGLPESIRSDVYTHTLSVLSANQQSVVLVGEIVGIVEASPREESTPEELRLLGIVLKKALQAADRPEAFLERLREGTATLGGGNAENRIRAAQLLLSAGLTDAAGEFLSPLADALESGAPTLLNLHAQHQEVLGNQQNDRQMLRRAWDLSQKALASGTAGPEDRNAAMTRLINLLPKMPSEVGRPWLDDLFGQRPQMGLLLLARVAQQLEQSYMQRMPPPRKQALEGFHAMAEGFLPHALQEPQTWSRPAQMLAFYWVNEAQKTVGGADRQIFFKNDNQIQPLPAKDIVATPLDPRWFDLLPDDLAWYMRRLVGELAAKAADQEKTRDAIARFVQRDKEIARKLAERFLQSWVTGGEQDPNDRRRSNRSYAYGPSGQLIYYGGSYGYGSYGSGPGGIPLTRAHQQRKLDQMSQQLGEFVELGVPALDPTILASVFDQCHSSAEVYRVEDIRRVFGPPEALPLALIKSLATTMRTKLAGVWRQPQVQVQNQTNRTDKQMAAEVERGYNLLLGMVENVAGEHAADAALQSLLASVLYDQAEFLYGQKVELKTYTQLRDAAFAKFEQAARLYLAALPGLAEQDQSVEVFRQWFRSALGASDLAYLTRQDNTDETQIERIAGMLRGLPDETAERHLKLFAEEITTSLPQVPAQLRPRYLAAAVEVVGDHPSADKARETLQLYKDLTSEVVLHVAIDGSTDVGHNTPFGAHLSLRFTKAMERESGGFRELLGTRYSSATRQQIDSKEVIEKEIREKLSGRFEIDSITWHDVKSNPRGYGRFDWRELPLAYLVLRARDAGVDTIPAMQIDLEFRDGIANVLLPITSQVVKISARDEAPPLRPLADLAINQILDDRQIEEGKIRLEITAEGKGIIGNLEDYLVVYAEPDAGAAPQESGSRAVAIPGFQLDKLENHGLAIETMDTERDEVAPIAQRSWVLELVPAAGEPATQFEFLAARDDATEMTYERYADADIKPAEAVVAIDPIAAPRPWWEWPLAGGVAAMLLAAVVLAVVVVRRRRPPEAEHGYTIPDHLTAFRAVATLRRIEADPLVKLSEGQRQELRSEIESAESDLFARREPNGEAEKIRKSAHRWIETARHHYTPAAQNGSGNP